MTQPETANTAQLGGVNALQEDQRRAIRKELPDVIDATNGVTGEVIGQIANLSIDGFMLITNQQMAEGATYQIEFCVALPGDAMFKFSVGSEALWCSQAKVADSYWIGMHIVDISDTDAETLHTLVGAL